MLNKVLEMIDKTLRNFFLRNFEMELEKLNESVQQQNEFEYAGIVSVLGLLGDLKGRAMMGVSFDLAQKLVKDIYQIDDVSMNDMLDVIYEIFNITIGNTLIEFKKAYDIKLRPSPPSLFLGENMMIVSPQIERKRIDYKTDHGNIFIEVGFERGR